VSDAHGAFLRGTIVYDTVSELVAEVMEDQGQNVALRRLTGGVEWSRDKDYVRTPTASERLRPKIAQVNHDSTYNSGQLGL
jgi:hypothetical protein